MNPLIWCGGRVACWVLPLLLFFAAAQTAVYPNNATSCEQCHSVPVKFGSSNLRVERVGRWENGKYVPAVEGGIIHRHGGSAQGKLELAVVGDRVSLNLLGDGFIEAIADADLRRNAAKQGTSKTGIIGNPIQAPVLESLLHDPKLQIGRFGWKDQHSSLMSACADSLRNELGIRNALYPDEYPDHKASDGPTPLDGPDRKTGITELERLLDDVRHTAPPVRDEQLAASPHALAGEQLFDQVGCSICHVTTYKTLPPGTLINGGTYRVPDFIGGKIIHPYSDFLLHNIDTGDNIPQAARPEYIDESTANKFRTAPLWGVRFRSWMMHDGKSITYHQAIMRHGGEAAKVRERYEELPPQQKSQLRAFLNSL